MEKHGKDVLPPSIHPDTNQPYTANTACYCYGLARAARLVACCVERMGARKVTIYRDVPVG